MTATRFDPVSSRPHAHGESRSIRGLAADLNTGSTTSTKLVQRALAMIDAVNGQLNAFSYVDRIGALTRAALLDQERRTKAQCGPLHGIPIAVKDVIDVAGMPTECGSAHMAGHIAAASAPVVRQLEALGAIVLGKTVTHEFAYGPTGDSAHRGASRNPCDATRMTGGSSGGSAAAVAAGIVALAIGTDTGGSCRIPAALCGVTGFKPQYGRLSMAGVFPLAPSLDHIGFLLADPLDIEIVSRELGLGSQEAAHINRPVTVGWLDPEHLGPADPAIVECCQSNLRDLDRAGAIRLVDVELPDPQRLQVIFEKIQSFEVTAVHRNMMRSSADLYQPDTLDRLSNAQRITRHEYIEATIARSNAVTDVLRVLQRDADVLATITTPLSAPVLGERHSHIADRTVATKQALLSMTAIWNLVGAPAASIPAGHIDGLPIGMQLVTARSIQPVLDLVTALAARADQMANVDVDLPGMSGAS
ncbi:amidase [Mycolicibacterium komossense]|uniref:Amidase n=1 Tax=Mycolicibacterium komossense TaxID=1779 RepID=A0ABT3CFF5_9MYCO|nr:amidase [Mycolicibacterium komossense]MCV7228216.1 amidase [Mycolicibacterium komossense]